MIYRIGYERLTEGEGTPWKIEDESGECFYTAEVVITAPAATVIEKSADRWHGYLQVNGYLNHGKERSTIRE